MCEVTAHCTKFYAKSKMMCDTLRLWSPGRSRSAAPPVLPQKALNLKTCFKSFKVIKHLVTYVVVDLGFKIFLMKVGVTRVCLGHRGFSAANSGVLWAFESFFKNS